MTASSTVWPPEDPQLRAHRGPHLAVDIALFTVAPHPQTEAPTLAALVHRRRDGQALAGEWALPGRMVRQRERLADAVRIALREKCGIEGLAPRQLFVADEPGRDSRGWVMCAAHIDTQRWEVLAPMLAARPTELALAWAKPVDGGVRFALPGAQKRLPFEQDEILAEAVRVLRQRYLVAPDPDGFLPETFTVLQLREVHEAVLGVELDKDLFRRKHIDALEATGQWAAGGVGRPAQVFKRRSA